LFAFEPFVASVVARYRAARFLGLCARIAVAVGLAGLVVSAIVQFVPLPSRATGLTQLSILGAGLLGAIAVSWALARRLPPTSEILFSLDRRLGTEARISSLYVLIRARRFDYFADRLGEAVARESEGWTRAFRPSRRTLALLAVSAALFVGIGAFAVTDKPAREERASSREGAFAAAEEEDGAEETASALLADEDETTVEGDWIRQALSELLAARDAAEEEAAAQDLDVAAVEAYTASLLEEMRETGARPLTSEELEKLSELAAAAPMVLGDALDAVLIEDDPKEIENQLELISEYAARQSLLQGMSSGSDEVDHEAPTSETAPGSSPAGDEGTAHPMSGFDDSGDEPSLVETPLPGGPGETGDVFEYITGGVPIELQPTEGDAQLGSDFRIDYDRVRTILDTRALPEGAFETVRRYFELVGSGGGR
jgi:hypothetical protein